MREKGLDSNVFLYLHIRKLLTQTSFYDFISFYIYWFINNIFPSSTTIFHGVKADNKLLIGQNRVTLMFVLRKYSSHIILFDKPRFENSPITPSSANPLSFCESDISSLSWHLYLPAWPGWADLMNKLYLPSRRFRSISKDSPLVITIFWFENMGVKSLLPTGM